jgi:hypothetical protein
MKKGNIFKKKSQKTETEEPEDVINPSDELEQDNEKVPADEETPEVISTEEKDEAESKPVPENKEISNKQKIAALKRTLLNKSQSLERDRRKVNDWRSQAKDRDEKATTEFQKRKTELEELIKKSEERYNKRIAKTKKLWYEYSDNYEASKINKIEKDIKLLEAELFKLEVTHPDTSTEETK